MKMVEFLTVLTEFYGKQLHCVS